MKRLWIITTLLTLVITTAGIAGFIYIKDTVPTRLTEAAELVRTSEDETEDQQVTKQVEDIIFESQKLVVQIEVDNGTIGSGFLYNDQGDILTNAHVVANASDVTIVMTDSKQLKGKVIGISRDTDVAVVRVPGLKGTRPLPLERENSAELLDEVLALGSPLGLQNTVTTGEITGLDRDFEIAPFIYEDVYQISAPISPGNSGGPLIDSKSGRVIGINSAKLDKESIGFSIPIGDVLPMVERWSESPMEALPDFSDVQEGIHSAPQISDEDQANYMIQYFYESINQGDFVTAYSLLGSGWQSTTSYEDFRAGYYNTLSVQLDDVISDTVKGQVKVTAFITAEETAQGDVKVKKYKVIYTVDHENGQMKILSGEGQQIDSNEESEEE
ncbi:S1C family serine protease [Thalassobacillus hwangdonensis]|uniref:S1C family serine protease n=1 Tax=Thalassobacillus hwangdonensis TaxID=546108 RepID=A0ABW3KVJ9_9BACI